MIRLYSFDIFDTILTRKVGNPTSAFYNVGIKLYEASYIKLKPEQFYKMRISCEKEARKNSKYEEITINEIYELLNKYLALERGKIKELINIELYTENELIIPIESTLKYIHQLQNDKNEIIIISDCYYPFKFIRNQFIKYGLNLDDENIFLSSVYKKTKETGNLYKEVLRKKNYKAYEILHHGNNYLSDIKVPQKIGFKTKYIEYANLNRYERILEKYSDQSNFATSIMAGTARECRLKTNACSEKENILKLISFNVLSPVLIAYTWWVLNEASKKKYKKLYFISRDGQILLKIANKINEKYNYNIELKYLYGSRQAWHAPSIYDITEKEIDWILAKTNKYDINNIFQRLNLDIDEIKEYLETHELNSLQKKTK